MCLAYCHVRALLFDTDTDEICVVCPHNYPEGRGCQSCYHRQGVICDLTEAPLPVRRWCCHCNQSATTTRIEIRQVVLWGAWQTWGINRVLDWYGVAHEGEDIVIADLNRPLTYGIPVKHWTEQWLTANNPIAETLPADVFDDFCVKL